MLRPYWLDNYTIEIFPTKPRVETTLDRTDLGSFRYRSQTSKITDTFDKRQEVSDCPT